MMKPTYGMEKSTKQIVQEVANIKRSTTEILTQPQFESEMVTLERIEHQKTLLRESSVIVRGKGKADLVLNSVGFGLHSRFQALLGLLEKELRGQVKTFELN